MIKKIKNDPIPFLLSLIFLFIYLIFLSDVPSLTHDSITYSNEIEAGKVVFHPHHLLYHVFSLYWYKLLNLLGICSYGLFQIASLNAIFGAAGIFVIYKIIRQLDVSTLQSAVFTSLAGFSFGYWFYSISVEVYIIPLFFILLAIYSFISEKSLILVAVFAGIAVLFHQIHVLFGVSIFATILLAQKYKDRKPGSLIKFSGIYALVIIVPYLLVMAYLNINSFEDISYWLTKYHHEVNSWNSLSPAILVKDFTGFSRALISSYGFFQVDAVQNLLSKVFADKNFSNEIYLLKDYGRLSIYFYVMLVISFAVVYLIIFIKILRNIKPLYLNDSIKILLFFISVYFIFFSFWDSANVEFWIPQATLLWIIMAYVNKKKRVLSLILLVLAFSINFFWAILPSQNINNDFYYARAVSARDISGKDAVIFESKWIIGEYLNKYTKLEPLQLRDVRIDSLMDYEEQYIYSPEVVDKLPLTAQSKLEKESVNSFVWYIIKE